MPTFQPYWGKPAVRNDRGDRGDVGIMRSPVRASVLPNCGGREVTRVPTAKGSVDGQSDAIDPEVAGQKTVHLFDITAFGSPQCLVKPALKELRLITSRAEKFSS